MDIFSDKKYIYVEEVFAITVSIRSCDNTSSVTFKKGLWSNSELDILKNYYPKGGSNLCKEKGLIRSQYAILNKAFKLNLKYSTATEWTDAEIELLKKHYKGGISYLKKLGLKKSDRCIRSKAKDLKLIKYSYWTENELEILKEYYKEGATMVKEKGVDKSFSAIFCKAHRLGLKKYSYSFSESDLDLIQRCYPIGGSHYVRLRGLDLDVVDIDAKAKSIGLKRHDANTPGSNGWGIEDTDILVKYYMLGGYPLCKEKGLKKSKISAMAKADQLKIKRFSEFEVGVALDTELTMTDKMELIGENRSIMEIKNVLDCRDI